MLKSASKNLGLGPKVNLKYNELGMHAYSGRFVFKWVIFLFP